MMTLGQFITRRRKHLRLTQEELAGKLPVSKSAVAKWEKDAGIPERDNLPKLAQALRVPVGVFYKIMGGENAEDIGIKADITPDVISALESFGYIVIRPGNNKDTGKEEGGNES